jgi:hypothetical protein
MWIINEPILLRDFFISLAYLIVFINSLVRAVRFLYRLGQLALFSAVLLISFIITYNFCSLQRFTGKIKEYISS